MIAYNVRTNSEKKRSNKLLNFYIVAVLLMPIIDQYRPFPIRTDYIFCFLGCIVYLLVRYKGTLEVRLEINKVLYLIYVPLVSGIMYSLTPNASFSYVAVRMGVFFVIYFNYYLFAYQLWDFNYAFNVYKIICIICSAIVIIQFIASLFGKSFTMIIPGAQINYNQGLMSDDVIRFQSEGSRFSSFFLEPSHLCEYVCPCLSMVLFSEAINKKQLFIALLFTIGMVASTSMTGIVIAAVLWGMFLYNLAASKKMNDKIAWLILIVILICIAIRLYQVPIIHEQFRKKFSSVVNGQIYRGSSLYTRVFYGWNVFGDLDMVNKIFGCGYQNTGLFFLAKQIGFNYVMGGNVAFMSGLTAILCQLGFLGSIIYFNIVIKPCIRCKDRVVYGLLT